MGPRPKKPRRIPASPSVRRYLERHPLPDDFDERLEAFIATLSEEEDQPRPSDLARPSVEGDASDADAD